MHKIPREVFVFFFFEDLKQFVFQNTGINVQIRTGIGIFFASFDANSFLPSKLIDDKHVKTRIEPNLHKIGKKKINFAEIYRKISYLANV